MKIGRRHKRRYFEVSMAIVAKTKIYKIQALSFVFYEKIHVNFSHSFSGYFFRLLLFFIYLNIEMLL